MILIVILLAIGMCQIDIAKLYTPKAAGSGINISKLQLDICVVYLLTRA